MVTEDYVSYEVAKLLKEKGFDEQCTYVYDSQHKLYSTFEQCRQITRNNSDWIYYVGKLNVVPIAVPTLQMAMKWLREVHNLYIWIGHAAGKGLSWYYEIHGISDGKVKHIGGIQCGSYEVACEAAITYCLTNLI